jgi:hypothetical protein
MKSTIDQISFNAENLIYTMFLSIAGNQHLITITIAEADSLIKDGLRNSKGTISFIINKSIENSLTQK